MLELKNLRERLLGRHVEILSRDAFWARCEITGVTKNHLTVAYDKPVVKDGAIHCIPQVDRIPITSLKRLQLYWS